jgi:hypothetical protein
MRQVDGQFLKLNGEPFYRVSNAQKMEEFFMSLSSSSDHWMFVSSYGALTAGRVNPEGAFFPYYADDKISDLQHCTGPKTLVRVNVKELPEKVIWEPFRPLNADLNALADIETSISRSIYKNSLGNKLVFEEVNEELGLTFRYQWAFGHRFGFIRSCHLENHGGEVAKVEILDGVENLLPPGLSVDFQMKFSNLANAYKKNELLGTLPDKNIGVYYLSSVPSDKAEPSEGLQANVVWHYGVDAKNVLLSSQQLNDFVTKGSVTDETDIRANRGAYFIQHNVDLSPGQSSTWNLVANTFQDTTDVSDLKLWLETEKDIAGAVADDISNCESRLLSLVSEADGIQFSEDSLAVARHQANVLFNVMRGGIPPRGYSIDGSDFASHVRKLNSTVADRNAELLSSLSQSQDLTCETLAESLASVADADLSRIGQEYLPLTFSRRHGDPTRPWNLFAIKGFADDGSHSLDYQGNWRDIFQNWEALAQSYPRLLKGMIFRFLNASTADGYNPYRVTKDGVEWERLDPDDAWSNIGYWGDHQIIYLTKLLESWRKFFPGELDQCIDEGICVYVDVPYRIKSYDDILLDANDTIVFDNKLDREIDARVAEIGSDGKLLKNSSGSNIHVACGEKLLLPAIVKMTNFVPGGGIWLNTQRPEWNDANNALVGNGLSMVTVCYLRRMFGFLKDWFASSEFEHFHVSVEIAEMLNAVVSVLSDVDGVLDASQRKSVVDRLGRAGGTYREALYANGLSGDKKGLSKSECIAFFDVSLKQLDQTIRENKRSDGLYHAYNLIAFNRDDQENLVGFEVEYLFEMLEGQVAALSAGTLSAVEVADLLDSLRNSSMYRDDRKSYTLYPNRDLPRFDEKNLVPADFLQSSKLAQKILDADCEIIRRGKDGGLHFCGKYRNVADLNSGLNELAQVPEFAELVASERRLFTDVYETVFNHHEFVGRSGTFFGYEGLGCIYWHMVSKLVLAVQENFLAARDSGVDAKTLDRLRTHYRESRDGIGLKMNPEVYGAFPTDPYSHTPGAGGAKQPGMTGQVKEDILVRFGELGLRVEAGRLKIDPCLFESTEFLTEPTTATFSRGDEESVSFELGTGSFAFTYCNVPFVYEQSEKSRIEVVSDSGTRVDDELELTAEETKNLISRDGTISRVNVFLG